MVTLDDGEVYDLVECLGETIGTKPRREWHADITNQLRMGVTYTTVLEWAERWDGAIAFYNRHVESSANRFGDPWVVNTLNEITGEL